MRAGTSRRVIKKCRIKRGGELKSAKKGVMLTCQSELVYTKLLFNGKGQDESGGFQIWEKRS